MTTPTHMARCVHRRRKSSTEISPSRESTLCVLIPKQKDIASSPLCNSEEAHRGEPTPLSKRMWYKDRTHRPDRIHVHLCASHWSKSREVVPSNHTRLIIRLSICSMSKVHRFIHLTSHVGMRWECKVPAKRVFCGDDPFSLPLLGSPLLG